MVPSILDNRQKLLQHNRNGKLVLQNGTAEDLCDCLSRYNNLHIYYSCHEYEFNCFNYFPGNASVAIFLALNVIRLNAALNAGITAVLLLNQ